MLEQVLRAAIYYNKLHKTVRYGVVANIIASHAIARGSIPHVGNFFSTKEHFLLVETSSSCSIDNVIMWFKELQILHIWGIEAQ